MCGIVGYVGRRRAQPILVNSLSKLEYRGYDSCGIAVSNGDLKVYKDIGRVKNLGKTLPFIKGTTGIAI